MITAEMKEMITKDNILIDIKVLKEEILRLKEEIEELKLTIQARADQTGWRHYND